MNKAWIDIKKTHLKFLIFSYMYFSILSENNDQKQKIYIYFMCKENNSFKCGQVILNFFHFVLIGKSTSTWQEPNELSISQKYFQL